MSINGVESLLSKLDRLGANSEEVLYKSLQKQGELVKGQAKELCPKDTGDLKKSIRKSTKRYKGKIVARVYTNSDHAAYVEFGTGKAGERTNKNNNVNVAYKQDKWRVNIPNVGNRWIEGQPAQPYLYPALKNNEDRIMKNIKEDLKKAIREVVRR
ncbi:HK97-gp10 family putative phage morphogenesis protein [Clostridium perfringens]|uniref:HK97-gp10 family putative phage morphogenesis protein n=1 Tax=Clostridium perfringens TaxID=1502 RepID=UPI00096A777A|nr:HK97-gp10 family putative phage morphogenesis protein [Clostridium perfringens]